MAAEHHPGVDATIDGPWKRAGLDAELDGPPGHGPGPTAFGLGQRQRAVVGPRRWRQVGDGELLPQRVTNRRPQPELREAGLEILERLSVTVGPGRPPAHGLGAERLDVPPVLLEVCCGAGRCWAFDAR